MQLSHPAHRHDEVVGTAAVSHVMPLDARNDARLSTRPPLRIHHISRNSPGFRNRVRRLPWFGIGIIGLIIWITIAFWPARGGSEGPQLHRLLLPEPLVFPLSLIMAYMVKDRSMASWPDRPTFALPARRRVSSGQADEHRVGSGCAVTGSVVPSTTAIGGLVGAQRNRGATGRSSGCRPLTQVLLVF